jgi:hypothetical protein
VNQALQQLVVLLLLLPAGMDEQGTVSQASVEAAIQQIAGGGSSNAPQHVTVIDAFQVSAACTTQAERSVLYVFVIVAQLQPLYRCS